MRSPMNHKTERDEALAKWQRECEGGSVPVTPMMRHAYRDGWADALAGQSAGVAEPIYQTRWGSPETVWGDVEKAAYDDFESFGYAARRIVYAAAPAPVCQSAGVPTGYALVPIEPTSQQLEGMCESYWGDGWDDEDLRYARIIDARNMYKAGLAAAPAPVSEPEQPVEANVSIYVDCYECRECGHVRTDDAHPTDAACGYPCGWSGPSPVEDKCPGCGKTNVISSACPKCSGLYRMIAEADIASTSEQPSERGNTAPSADREQVGAAETEQSIAADSYFWIAERIGTLDGYSVQDHVDIGWKVLQDCADYFHDFVGSDEGGDDAAVRIAADLRAVLSGRLEQVEAKGVCQRCGGTGVVDDGEIVGVGGVEFENGAVKCVKDCPDCAASAATLGEQQWPADRDAAIQACALMILGICKTEPQEVWPKRIEGRIRYMLSKLQPQAAEPKGMSEPAVHIEADQEEG